MSHYVPVVGGYDWRKAVARLLESEEAEVDAIMRLIAASKTPATSELLAGLLAGKTKRISELNRLLNYRDGQGGND